MENRGKYYNIEKLLENTNQGNSFIENLIKMFVSKYEDKIHTFKQLADDNNFTDLTSILHQLKSNLPYLAQPEIRQEITDLHHFSLHNETEKVKLNLPKAVTNMENLIKELKDVFLDNNTSN